MLLLLVKKQGSAQTVDKKIAVTNPANSRKNENEQKVTQIDLKEKKESSKEDYLYCAAQISLERLLTRKSGHVDSSLSW